MTAITTNDSAQIYPGRKHSWTRTLTLIGGMIAMSHTATAQSPKAGSDQKPTLAADIRPFQFHASEEALTDLRLRLVATQWPEKETVEDASQGVPLATMQELARYWATEYDWRKCEGKLNALPQFITQIDGLDIHFIHVRSKHKNALPVV